MQQQSFLFPPRQPSRRNLVIEAGAGTGKTTAIVGEVLKLMLERDELAPERIVLMTFTEKAAGEIADRIREALVELQAHPVSWPPKSPNPLVTIADEETARRRIAHHLENIDALRSQTIHSFCQSLLRTFPIEAGLDPQFKIVEGFERSLLYGQVYDAWLDHETRVAPSPETDAEWELVFAHLGYLFQIRDVVLALMERRDLLAEADADFGNFERDVQAKLEDAVLWIRRESTTCKDAAATHVAEYLRTTRFDGGSLDQWIDYLQPIAAAIRQIDFRYCGALKEPMTFLRAGDRGNSVYDRLVSHRAAMALLALTRRFIAFLDAEKRKLGVVDFDDLLLRTLALLDDEVVLKRARDQFDFIFVDEFQDTDRTQAHIIDKLARDASGAFVDGKTIVVGDPKQSIYGFRRADPETYYRMTEDLVGGGAERRILGEQYRSDAPLVETVNRIFERLLPLQPHDPNVFRPAYNPLHPARTKLRRELDARVTLLAATHEEKSDRYFAEAEAIAEWIKSRGEGDLRRFAILFRRLTKLDDYLDTFDRHGIDYVLPPTRMFLDRRAPVDLLAVLRAIAYSFDRGAQISAARTPYFALTDEEIAEGMLKDEGGRMKDEESEASDSSSFSLQPSAFQEFQRTIDALRDQARHLTVSGLIDLVIETTGIEQVYDAAADGIRHHRHLEHVRAIAFEYDERIGGSVRQFIEEVDRRRDEPDETEPSLADESQNAVRILSVHAAKGLEFETVILPDLAVMSPPDGLNLFSVEEPKRLVLNGRADSISSHFLGLAEISGQREDAESRRLFYVAVTRAITDVVFVCNPDEKRSVGFHRSLIEALGIDKKSFASWWPAEGREVRQTDIGPVAFEKVELRGTASNKRRRLHDTALESSLASSAIVPAEIPPPPLVTDRLGRQQIAALRAGARNRAAGVLLHRVLELWDGHSPYEPLLNQLAIEAAADPDAVTRVRHRLATITRSPTLHRIARAQTLGRELTIRFLQNGTPVERRIDRLIREQDRDLVIDYKSGAREPKRVEKDRDQVARYCTAVAAMTGRPCEGIVWYVDLERDEVEEVSVEK